MGNDDYNDQNEEEEIKRLEREVSRLEIRGQQRAGEAQRLRQELAAQEQQLRQLEVKFLKIHKFDQWPKINVLKQELLKQKRQRKAERQRLREERKRNQQNQGDGPGGAGGAAAV